MQSTQVSGFSRISTHVLRPNLRQCVPRAYCDSTNQLQLPPEPTTCCMSGCANCVWIEYAQQLSKLLGDDGASCAKNKIMEKVQDPNLRSFLLLELKTLKEKPDS